MLPKMRRLLAQEILIFVKIACLLLPHFSHPPHMARKKLLWGHISVPFPPSPCPAREPEIQPVLGPWATPSGGGGQPIRSLLGARATMNFRGGLAWKTAFRRNCHFIYGSAMDRHGTSTIFQIMSPRPFPVFCTPERCSH